ncbi:hypothetical protein ACFL6U_06305 [Planctomycetota bacterium]
MESKYVLVLGRQGHHEIPQALTALGYNPIVRGSVIHCYEKLRSEYIVAVIVESDFTHADVLEFVLNVRDLDETVPIVVLGRSCKKNHEHKLIQQKHVFRLDLSTQEQRQSDKVKAELNNILKVTHNEVCIDEGR